MTIYEKISFVKSQGFFNVYMITQFKIELSHNAVYKSTFFIIRGT